jgi:soluble lytic murein transglycosylase-like protein
VLADVGDCGDCGANIRGGNVAETMIWLILIVAVVLMLAVTSEAGVPGGEMDLNLNAEIQRAAHNSGVDAALIYGVVMTESSGNPNARNPSDPSAGLMGVTPLIGRYYGGINGSDAEVLAELLHPEPNLRAGSAFLAHLRTRYAGAMPVVTWIQAYNLGEAKFNAGKRVPDYAERVLKFMVQAPEFA